MGTVDCPVDTLRAVQSRIEEEPMLPSVHHANHAVSREIVAGLTL
jgi:hypothetical protein